MRRAPYRIVCILTVFFMVLSGTVLPACAYTGTSDYYDLESEYHADVDYDDMVIQWIDEDATEAFLDEYEQLIAEGDEDALISGYDRLCALLDYTDTMQTLNEIRHNRDINNEEYEELSDYFFEYNNEMSDRIYGLMRDALKSSCGEALKEHIGNDDLVEDLLEYEDMTEEQKDLSNEFIDLTHEYESLLIKDYHAEVNGRDWTLDEAMADNGLTFDEYWEIVKAIYREMNREIAPLYPEIVRNRNRAARLLGYDNYADYAYVNIYNRDYTHEDIEKVYEDVRNYIVPLGQKLDEKKGYNYRLENMDISGEERIERVAPVISKIHPDLQIAWDYMTEHGLYDLDASPSKMETGYTVDLHTYGAEFIFDSPYRDWNDIQTLIHEFGHYNEGFHSPMRSIDYIHNMDVCEIHSQGLELLCLDYADEIYGRGCGDDVTIEVLSSMCDAVKEACIHDEFQYRAYTYDGELTPEYLNLMYLEIANKYGEEYEFDDPNAYAWVCLPHTFEQPLYYISYGTSALAALDILAMSRENREAAVDCYMHLTTYHGELGYRETLEDVGLPDIFEDGVIEDISIAVADYAGIGISIGQIKRLLGDPWLMASLVVVLAVIIIIVIVRISTSRERRARKQYLRQMQMMR